MVTDNLSRMTQKTFADLNWEQKYKKTRRERFLGEMELAVPWKELVKLIVPVAPRSEPGPSGGRPAYPVEVMLRIYLCQTWYNLPEDPLHVGEPLSQKKSSCRCAGVVYLPSPFPGAPEEIRG